MDFAKVINDSISTFLPEKQRNYIGASSIGRSCSRAIWYDLHQIEGEPLTCNQHKIFEIGKRLEKMVIDYIIHAGFKVEEACKDNNYLKVVCEELPILQGHMDGILHLNDAHKAILEIKTAKHERYDKYIKDSEGVKGWAPIYYTQIQTYMGLSGINQTLFCVLNKNNGDWHMEWINYDDICFSTIKARASFIASHEEPPEKINKSPFYYACQQCKFKKTCHELSK